MQNSKIKMSTSYRAIFVFSILMAFVVFLVRAGMAVFFWGYTVWLMYKRKNSELVTFYRGFLWIDCILFSIGLIVFLLSDGEAKQLMGYSFNEFLFFGFIVIGLTYGLYKYFTSQLNMIPYAESEKIFVQSKVNNTTAENFPDKNWEGNRVSPQKRFESMEDAYARIAPSTTSDTLIIDAGMNSKNNERLQNGSNANKISSNEVPLSKINVEPSLEDWELALSEYDGNQRNNGLWAKLYAKSKGDENLIKAEYLHIRANQIALLKK